MELINAISKARFGSAKPQRIQLHKGESLTAELLCLEAGQKTRTTTGEWTYYVVTGTASVTSESTHQLPTGQLATLAAGENHVI